MPPRWRRTKIICTLGPSTDKPDVMRRLLTTGFDVGRINTAHGTPAEHRARIKRVRDMARRLGKTLGILVDLPGPKLRLGDLAQPSMELRRADTVVLGSDARAPAGAIPVSYPKLAQEVEVGESIHLADGTVKLVVTHVGPGWVRCHVEVGGVIRSHSGINLPESDISVTLPTDDDEHWIAFGCQQQAEWLGVSFVRTPADVRQVRRRLTGTAPRPMLMAKIEKRQALAQLSSIIDEADGVMVARGDLGVETPLAEVPIVQKRIIQLANELGKPVVTATQMLESMVEHGTPTRAEVTDVANAVLDGSGAVMLSAETAIGAYPVEAVKTMHDVIHATEPHFPYAILQQHLAESAHASVADAISLSACRLADRIDARAIVVPLETPSTAFRIARYHPRAPVVAVSTNPVLARQLTVAGGVVSLHVPSAADDKLRFARQWLVDQKLARRGNPVIVVSDSTRDPRRASDSLQVLRV